MLHRGARIRANIVAHVRDIRRKLAWVLWRKLYSTTLSIARLPQASRRLGCRLDVPVSLPVDADALNTSTRSPLASFRLAWLTSPRYAHGERYSNAADERRSYSLPYSSIGPASPLDGIFCMLQIDLIEGHCMPLLGLNDQAPRSMQ